MKRLKSIKEYLLRIWYSEAFFAIRCTTEGMVIFVFLIVTLVPALVLIFNAYRLKWFWLPVFLGYIALFIAGNAWLIRQKIMREERLIVGDELFFKLHPKELKREERVKRLAAKRQKRAEERIRRRDPYHYEG